MEIAMQMQNELSGGFRQLTPAETDVVAGGLMVNSITYPPGCSAYGQGGYYMRCSDGDIYLTPGWQEQVDSGDINWAGVLTDLALILGAGVSILGVWGSAAGTVIVAGAEAIQEMMGN